MAASPANKEWNFSVASVLNNEVTRAQKTVEDNFSQIRSLAPATVLNVRDGQAKQTQAKFAVQGAIDLIKEKAKNVQSMVDMIIKNRENTMTNINSQQTEIDQLKKDVEKERTLATLRKEQSEALKQKYVGNFHSSWFGLWRPLTEQSRVGLLITAVLFAVISMVSIGFFIYLHRAGFPAFPTSSSTGSRNLYVGGFRFFK
jgi:hypothetical protein